MKLIRKSTSMFLASLAMVLCLVSARVDAAAPAPKWLTGFPLRAGNSVILMWTPIPGATGYRLFRKTGESPLKEIYNGAANTYSDASVSQSDTVTYKVAGILKDTDSEMSVPAMLKGIERLPPPSITGAIGSSGFISLRWSSPPRTMFSNIYRAESENGEYTLQESAQMETFTDRKAEKGKTYFYRITAVGTDGKESPRSAPIRASLRETAEGGAASGGQAIIRKLAALGSFRGEELYELNQPSDTGFTSGGELYVLERRGIQFFDRDGAYRRRITFNKAWGLPGGLVEDRDGSILVPFYAEQVIRRVDPTGKPVSEIRYPPYVEKHADKPKKQTAVHEPDNPDSPGTAAPPLPRFRNNPNQIAIDGKGFYWVLDGIRAQVIKINTTGEEFAVLGRPPGTYDAREMTEADLPTAKGIQYNPFDGKLYVALGVTAQIKVIDPGTAAVVATFGGLGTGNSQFQGIGGLAFRKNGNILVLDHLMQTIKEFNPKYGYVATYVDVVERNEIKLSSNLLSNFAFNEEKQRFYISSAMGNRVYKFDILPPGPVAPPPPPLKRQPKPIWK